ncbi:MAG TPA: hypothetical protein VNJ02_07585 [Vicinamibacterales bacterium]|nr:hypothetical protein [Vicinamibacterales bacterium]
MITSKMPPTSASAILMSVARRRRGALGGEEITVGADSIFRTSASDGNITAMAKRTAAKKSTAKRSSSAARGGARKSSAKKSGAKKSSAKKSGAKKRASAKRDTVNSPTATLYAKRSTRGRFTEMDEKGRSLKADRTRKAKKKTKSGYGDQGDR